MTPCAKRALVALMILVLGLMVAGPAGAEETHLFAGSFGEGELSLDTESGVAINQGAGGVYVADTGNNRIAKYTANGGSPGTLAAVTAPTFLAVDNSSDGSNGDIYVVAESNSAILKLTSAGALVNTWGTGGRLASFGEIDGIAVDPSGHLWVLGADRAVHELNPAGSQTSECTAPRKLPQPRGIAVDTSGDLYYIRSEEEGEAVKISTTCELLVGEFGAGHGNHWGGIATSETDNSVFLDRGEAIEHFSSGGAPLAAFGEEGLAGAAQLAVRTLNEAVYVVDTVHDRVAIFAPAAVEPPEVTILPPNGVTGTTAHFKAEINPKGHPGTYAFHCIPACSGTGLTGTLAAGTVKQTVEAIAEHLKPATEYKVYIVAENVGGATRSPEEPVEGLPFTTGVVGPSIEEESVTEVSETTASVAAMINPGGAPTGYWVEYLTRAQFEISEWATASRTPEETIAPASSGVPVSVELTGLVADTPYVARVVATNLVETVFGEPQEFKTREPSLSPPGGCANEIYRVGPSAALSDCRAYEQASPADKNGGGVGAVPGAVQATDGPDSVTFFSQAGLPGGVGAQDYPTFISSRGEGAWGTQGLLPPQSLGRKADYLGLTPGGHYAVTSAATAGSSGESPEFGLFRRNLSDGQVTTIVPYDSECELVSCFALVGASADGSLIFFESTAPLTGETIIGQPNVFLWEEESDEISLVDTDEAGAPLPEGGFAGPYDWLDGNLLRGGAREPMYVRGINTISSDGSEAIYTERGEVQGDGQLYLRRGLGGSSPTTVKVSAYEEGLSGPELPAAFLEATPDGRYVFFKSKAELTGDAYAGGPGEESESLYRYDVSTGTLIDLTPDPAEEREGGPGVEGLLGTSASGDAAYFVAKAVLTEEEGPTGAVAVEGQPNLYRWQVGHPLAFVAMLGGGNDARDWSPAVEDPEIQGGVVLAKTARVSADGGAAVFSSHRSLTEAPNLAPSCGAQGCPEFFRYAAQTETLTCISCNRTGARPLGPATIGTAYIEAEDNPTVKGSAVLTRNLSADGDRFFFQTPDPLVSGDENAKAGCTFTDPEHASCLDVYEWEAPGVGSCPQATVNANGGCLYLISSGHSVQASYFADADRTGANAYFMTSAELVPVDGDQLYDVYDAREGGGLGSQSQSSAPPCASRLACQGPQAGPEGSTSPGTSNFSGPPNPKAPPACKKGFVRRGAKCVKKPKANKKRHHRKKHKQKKGKASAKQRAARNRGGRA